MQWPKIYLKIHIYLWYSTQCHCVEDRGRLGDDWGTVSMSNIIVNCSVRNAAATHNMAMNMAHSSASYVLLRIFFLMFVTEE